MIHERVRELVHRVEGAEALDPVVEPIRARAQELTGSSVALKNALSGTWLGHRLHPLLTILVVGTWMSSWLVDLLGGREGERSADRLLAIGAASALPTALTGASDWSDAAERPQHRVGLVHAAANYLGLSLQLASLLARRRGDRTRAKVLSTLGVSVVGVGGYLGGHLAYVQGVGVDHPTGDLGAGWRTTSLGLDDLIEGQPRGYTVDGVDLVLVRQGGAVYALAATCTHAGGPLDQGRLDDGCIVCPWHASSFRLTDGSIVRAPAVTPQPVFRTRVVDGRLEVAAGER